MKHTTGLSTKEVTENRKKYGTNTITNTNEETFFKLFIETLGDPIIKILIIALGIKIVFLIKDFDWYETVGIVISILLASLISTISEYGSNRAFRRLQEESSKIKCRVIRNNKIEEIIIDEIVVDDLLLLESGDKVGADGNIISGKITVDESSMTGESKEVSKEAYKDLTTVLDKNKVFRGTVVTEGTAKVLVKKVGDNTFYGKVAKELQEKSGPSPLKLRLTTLAQSISKIGYVGAFLVAISYLFSKIVIANNFDFALIKETICNFPIMLGYILHALTLSVTIIIVAVPEGLPMMITLVLSSNMKKMLKDNILVRKLVGIETAGSLNILFTDKTGTLTYGKLQVTEVMLGNQNKLNNLLEFNHPQYNELLIDSLLYNNESAYDPELNKIIGGNITDRALLNFIKQKRTPETKIIDKVPFNSTSKYSLTTIERTNQKRVLIKGAWEKILDHCNTYYDESGTKQLLRNKTELERIIKERSLQGIRVLVCATCDEVYRKDFRRLTLVGIIFIKDEVRTDAIEGIKLVRQAGIKTVMITGDNPNTAQEIAKEVGLIESSEDLVLASDELNRMNDNKIKEILPRLSVVARALPQDKSRLVKIAQELDLVVGMTGDGVNDAPALKKADVGFAMGSGTEVSKEASDIVILDDNFLSITKAILYGRTIFKSIRKFIIFQLTVNFCAISVSIIGPFINIPTPVTVIQMLWINMVMDTLAGIAFSHEPALLEYMNEQPKRKNEPIINQYMLNEILITGLYSSLLCIFFLKSQLIYNLFGNDYNYHITAFFGLFIFLGIFNAFNARTERINLTAHLTQNKIFLLIISFIVVVQILIIYYGGTLFRTTGLSLNNLIYMLSLALTVIPFDFTRKITLKLLGKKAKL